MTKKELLHLLVLQARASGFELRKWYQSKIEREWTGSQAAMGTLASGHRYYALLFSHAVCSGVLETGHANTIRRSHPAFQAPERKRSDS